MIPTMTLNRFIHKRARRFAGSTGELSDLLSSIALGVKMISNVVATAAFKNMHGYTGDVNVQGEKTQKLDEHSNEILTEILGSSGHFGLLASEETDQVIPTQAKQEESLYVVAFDPLDGSSNLGFNVSVGTIFAIFKKLRKEGPAASEGDFYQPGREVVAAGYSVYSSSTVFVYSCGDGVHEFTLDPSVGEFILTDEDVKIPAKSGTYSINEGNSARWNESTTNFVDSLKFAKNGIEKPYSARYIGSLVADFHRNLKKGGIFLYPSDKKNARGKLRLLYECIPMAFIAEQAGGRASDGEQNVLDIVPSDIHERCPLIVGNTADVDLYEKIAKST